MTRRSTKGAATAAPKPNKPRYGPIIAAARVRHGLSQPHAAEALGVSLTTLRAYEQGKRSVPADRRAFIAEQWGIDRKELGLDLGVCPCCQRPF